MELYRRLPIALCAAVVACGAELGPYVPRDFGFSGGLGGGGGTFTMAFMLYPPQLTMLEGDTARLSISSTENHTRAGWITRGRAVRFVEPLGAPDTVVTIAQEMVWIRATGIGIDTVFASAADTWLRDTSTFLVVDSSAITQIEVWIPTDTLKVGATQAYKTLLFTDGPVAVRGTPTSWSSSDTTIARILPPVVTPAEIGVDFSVQATMKPGKVTLTFDFLAVRKTVDLVVVP